MKRVLFTYCTEDVVIQEHSAFIDVPDDVCDVTRYIEEHYDDWVYEGWEGIAKVRCTGEPMEIEVQDD